MYKYTYQDVVNEADLILAGYTLDRASAQLVIPRSTISWHLIHVLVHIDYNKWSQIRKKFIKWERKKASHESKGCF